MEIAQEQLGEVYVVAPQGRLDTDSASDLELALQDLDAAGAKHFVVDLAGIGYVSSAGLRVLTALSKSCENGGSLRLAGMSAQVKQVFDVAGFTKMFKIYPDRAAALDKHPHGGAAPAPAAPAPAKAPAAAPAVAPAAAAAAPAAAAPAPAAKPGLGKLAASLMGAKGGEPKPKSETGARVAKTVAGLMDKAGKDKGRKG
jgi:anti-anti-sigma factor